MTQPILVKALLWGGEVPLYGGTCVCVMYLRRLNTCGTKDFAYLYHQYDPVIISPQQTTNTPGYNRITTELQMPRGS
jgi:hypothetical protein